MFCKEDGVSSRRESVTLFKPLTRWYITTTLRHTKYGIYFTLVTETSSNSICNSFEYQYSSNSNERIFKRRCDNWANTNLSWRSLNCVNYAKHTISESIKNFSRYNIKVRCNWAFDANSKMTSDWLQIKANL